MKIKELLVEKCKRDGSPQDASHKVILSYRQVVQRVTIPNNLK
jgi:hypothetical protein